MRQSPEILAPAGSMEALTAAVHCGADAVYIGATLFSARQNAHNFDAAALREAADFCHTNGVKLYLTVNTLVFDTEWAALDELLQTAAAVGMDACIVQDLGVADYIHQRIPEMPLHASTQMTICSPSGAIWAKEHGFSRVVVAREMTRSEIQAVCAIGLEVEQFVHGALCMCISGQCYLSALIGARSANRGCCAQACRLPFTAAKNPQAAALSLKDLCLLPHYQQLCADGIASLKIEGRMKRPEYVAAAVTALRQLKEGNSQIYRCCVRYSLAADSQTAIIPDSGNKCSAFGRKKMSLLPTLFCRSWQSWRKSQPFACRSRWRQRSFWSSRFL